MDGVCVCARVRDFDEFMYDHDDFLILSAAGNDGPSSVRVWGFIKKIDWSDSSTCGFWFLLLLVFLHLLFFLSFIAAPVPAHCPPPPLCILFLAVDRDFAFYLQEWGVCGVKR